MRAVVRLPRFHAATAISRARTSFVPHRTFAVIVEKVPSLGDSINDGKLMKWQKQIGEKVQVDDVIVAVETDKVVVDLRASQAGVLTWQVPEGETVIVGAEFAKIDTDATPTVTSAAAAPAAAAAAPAAANKATTSAVSSTPVPAAKPAEKKPAAAAIPTAPAKIGCRDVRRVPMTRMRSTIAKRLKEAQNTYALLTTFNEIDMTNVMELRNRFKDDFAARHNVKLGFMSFFVKAASNALMKQPDVNGVIEGEQIVYRDYVDISVAVATPTGLVVPVLRNCEGMSFAGVESAIAALGEKARKGQISLEDMSGGTFTISNGGVYGSLMGTPIVNPPQSAILGMHGIFKRPIAVGDKVEIRPMMYVALTYDHRIIDGQQAVTFLKDIKSYIEDPSRLLLDL